MTTGAIILAAGMAETFGPIQTTGTITVAQRIVATLQKAGITRILVITGYQAEDLEHHLTKNNIVFIRNVNYTNSEMIDSARMGLSFLSDKCDKIVLCPCDIPFFTARTVQTLLNTEGDYIRPVWQGQTGHPIVCS
ncbi:MAG: NTP transferase domain-containing protein, partial [Erysipelotrichaceae bacterium]|nr:NTP transferase domain-containing protein [Erysipelotrichaceae bacterium]